MAVSSAKRNACVIRNESTITSESELYTNKRNHVRWIFLDFGLTYGIEEHKWLVEKAINSGYVVEVWMLSNKSPLCEILPIIEIGDCNLHTPILLVVGLNMPMDPDWAHVWSTLKHWCTCFYNTWNSGIAPVILQFKYMNQEQRHI